MKMPFSSIFPCTVLISLTFQIVFAQSLINETCTKFARDDPNINYDFCVTSLQAAPASQCASLKGLGLISMRLVLDNATDTRCYIKQLSKSQKGDDPYAQQRLNDCFELFSDAIPSVKQGMRSYNAKRYDDANIQIGSVMDAVTTCEDGFQEKKGVVSPLTKRNNDTFQLSAIALSVMHMLQTGSY